MQKLECGLGGVTLATHLAHGRGSRYVGFCCFLLCLPHSSSPHLCRLPLPDSASSWVSLGLRGLFVLLCLLSPACLGFLSAHPAPNLPYQETSWLPSAASPTRAPTSPVMVMYTCCLSSLSSTLWTLDPAVLLLQNTSKSLRACHHLPGPDTHSTLAAGFLALLPPFSYLSS